MARIEGTGIKAASKDSKKVAQVYYGGPEAENRRRLNNFLKEFGEKSPLSGGSGGTIKIPDMVPVPKASIKGDETFEKKNFFSPDGGAFDERNDVKFASASGDFSGTFNESDDFSSYIKGLGIKNPKGLPPTMQRMLKQNYKDDVRDGFYKEGNFINKAPKEEKPSFIAQTKRFAGNVFDAITGTQRAEASQISGGMPTSDSQFTSSNLNAAKAQTGDTSFAAYRMAGEPKQSAAGILGPGTGVKTEKSDTPFADGGRGVNLPSDYAAGEKAAFEKAAEYTARKTPTNVAPPANVAERQTVASLPSDYKQTEAAAFAAAEAYQQAKKNPNVKAGVDSKGQVSIKPANNTGKARAQAAALNRKASGKSISSVKAANKAKMRASAAARHSAFKKTGKSTVSARRAAAKKSMQARAKKRHSAFKKRRKQQNKKRRCDIFLKYNISPLTNMNLIRDDLAEVAYFVKEIQK